MGRPETIHKSVPRLTAVLLHFWPWIRAERRLSVFSMGLWDSLATNASAPTNPGVVSSTIADPTQLWPLFNGPGQNLSFSVVGVRGTSGNGFAKTARDPRS